MVFIHIFLFLRFVLWHLCPLTKLCNNIRIDLSWHFHDRSYMAQESIWSILGMFYLETGISFHFSKGGMCLLYALQENLSTDFHDIFRLRIAWHRQQLVTFRSRLFSGMVRPFHVLQMERGGALRSQMASCYDLYSICMFNLKVYLEINMHDVASGSVSKWGGNEEWVNTI